MEQRSKTPGGGEDQKNIVSHFYQIEAGFDQGQKVMLVQDSLTLLLLC